MRIIETVDADGNDVTIKDDGYRLWVDGIILMEYDRSEVVGARRIVAGLLDCAETVGLLKTTLMWVR